MTELRVHHRTPVQKCAGTGKPDDATLPDETQPVFHTSVNHSRKNCKLGTRLQSFTNHLGITIMELEVNINS